MSAGTRSLFPLLICFTSLLRSFKNLLLTGLNFVVWIIFSIPSSNSFNSSIGSGFLVDLKPYVFLVDEGWSGLRKKCAFQRVLRKKFSVFSMRERMVPKEQQH